MTALSPFDLPRPFLKGNIHTHSNRSDGMLPLDEVALRYRAAGYDFLSMTDHFMRGYDFPITDISHLADERFTPIFGAELHAPRTEMSALWHLVTVGLPTHFAPPAEDEHGPALARRAKAAGAFVGIAHPAWYQLSMDDAETLIDAADAVEIYNHGCQVMHDKGDGAYLLDGLADKGHRMLTYACDDAHFRTPDFGGGWVMLKAPDRSAGAIVEALKAGQFYSTQGPTIQNVELQGDKLFVECSPAAGILIAGKGYQHSYCFEAGISRAELSMEGLDGSPWFRVIVFGQDGKRPGPTPIGADVAAAPVWMREPDGRQMTKRPHARTAMAKIRLEISRMPAAQARVAEVFLDHPEEAIRASVADLAAQARCGEASVIRFCHTIGFDNLRDLRVALAAETAYRQEYAPRGEIDQVDRLCTALRSTAERLDRNALRRVAVAMKVAPHTDVFGSGVSGMGAHLFAYRFSRIGLVARAWSDEVAADEILPSRRAGSVAMIVSETGLTLRTENFLKKSRQAGAFTVAICGQSADALEPLCDEVLAVTPLNPLPERGEMAPLLGKLLLCDRIAAEVLAIAKAGHVA